MSFFFQLLWELDRREEKKKGLKRLNGHSAEVENVIWELVFYFFFVEQFKKKKKILVIFTIKCRPIFFLTILQEVC